MKHKTITTCVYGIVDEPLPVLVYVKLLKLVGWQYVYGGKYDKQAEKRYRQQSSY